MKLNSFISVIDCDETVHITNGDTFMFHGTIGDAYRKLPEDYLKNARVIYVRTLLGALNIEAYVE